MASIHLGTTHWNSACSHHCWLVVRHCAVAVLVDVIALAVHAPTVVRAALVLLLVIADLLRCRRRQR